MIIHGSNSGMENPIVPQPNGNYHLPSHFGTVPFQTTIDIPP